MAGKMETFWEGISLVKVLFAPKVVFYKNCTGLETKAAWEHGVSSLGERAPKTRDLDVVDKQQ